MSNSLPAQWVFQFFSCLSVAAGLFLFPIPRNQARLVDDQRVAIKAESWPCFETREELPPNSLRLEGPLRSPQERTECFLFGRRHQPGLSFFSRGARSGPFFGNPAPDFFFQRSAANPAALVFNHAGIRLFMATWFSQAAVPGAEPPNKTRPMGKNCGWLSTAPIKFPNSLSMPAARSPLPSANAVNRMSIDDEPWARS